MARPRWIAATLVAWLGASNAASAGAGEFRFDREEVMGTSFELRVRADSAEAAAKVEARALDEIDRLSGRLSGYDPASEFARWSARPGPPARLSAELFEVLAAADRWRERTGGAFDPRAATLGKLWSDGAKAGRVPNADELAAALGRMARPAWRLDPAAGTAERLSDVPVTLNAIAKGDIVERACRAGMDAAPGVRGVLLNVGGDLHARGDEPWTVAIASANASAGPSATVRVRNQSVATSGGFHRGVTIDGRWYSHIVDPRTGLPAARDVVATVIAANGADADAFATALNLIDPAEGVRLAESLPGVLCRVVTPDGRVARSAGWDQVEAPPVMLALADDPKAAAKPEAKPGGEAPWGDANELVVKFEINKPEAAKTRGYHRPYVAVWVEDEKGFPVRNLLLWVSLGGSGPDRWLPDLRRWYRSDRARRVLEDFSMVPAIGQPTRPPGQYEVVWDGRDDHNKPLPRGKYTVFLDAAREHGTYQGMHRDVTIADTPFAEDLKGNVEIKSAAIEYRRKGAK